MKGLVYSSKVLVPLVRKFTQSAHKCYIKTMNTFLWFLQYVMAVYFAIGGIYLTDHYKLLANTWAIRTLPAPFWFIFGSIEVILAAGLIIRGQLRYYPKLIPISAVGLAVISLLGIFLFSAYSGLGILWAIIPTIILMLIAYGQSKH